MKRAQLQSPTKFQFKPGEYYLQCAETNHFLALQGNELRLDDRIQERIPTFTGLVKLVRKHDGSTALYSSLNGKQLKVDSVGDVVAVSREEKRAGKDLEDFELIKAEGIEYGQLIIRSLQIKKFVRIEHNTLHADESDSLDASKFVLKSRYLFCFHLTVGDRTLGERPEIMNTLCLAFSRLPLPHNASVTLAY